MDNSENEDEADDGEPAEIDFDKLKCLLCMKKFPNLVKLAFHMNSQHYNSVEDKGFKCPKCELFYESEAELREHIKDEHPKTCSICQQTVKNMSAHMRNEHSNFSKTPFHCIDCDFKSHTQKNLSKHMKEKHSQNPEKVETVRFDENIADGSIKQTYLCKSCDLEFTRRPEYQTHYFMKHYTPGSWTNGPMGKEFVFTCDHCTFSGRLGQMYKHYQKEHPEDDYVLSCTECDFQVVVGEKKNMP